MARSTLKGILYSMLLIATVAPLTGLPNLTRNEQFPLYSSWYPYAFLATKQKASLMRFDYTYLENRFRVSLSGYTQWADRGRDTDKNVVNLGDMNGRWNMLAMFYDPKMRAVLYPALGIDGTVCQEGSTTNCIPDENCKNLIEDPRFVDPNQEFGFFSIPLCYRKFGVRFEGEILLFDKCFYAVGLKAQWGIADIRQTAKFQDFTCQALGEACPANNEAIIDSCPKPGPAEPTAITPPFVDPVLQPPCGPCNSSGTDCTAGPCPPNGPANCVDQLQPFQPNCNQTLMHPVFDARCKQFVINNIMNQSDIITNILGLDTCNYHKVGLDDLRLLLYWRQIFVMNEDDERYPRVLFMPFFEAGVGIPMTKEISSNKPFAVPLGNNHHTYVGATAGFTIDFLDTIDLSFAGGFSYFFRRDYCNYRLPTAVQESGIFPYSADVSIRPGPTWFFNFGMHAYHFLDNLSFWIEGSIVSHAQDKIKVCKSFIPEGSIYWKPGPNSGFDVERAECLTKWEVYLANAGFNYDLTDNFAIGVAFQAPWRQRNAYRTSTFMGTITFVY